MSTVLERKPVTCSGGVVLDKAIQLGHLELRKKADEMFSPGKHCHRSTTPEAVENALEELQIGPYTYESVSAYKAAIDKKWRWKYAPVRIADAWLDTLMCTTIGGGLFYTLIVSTLLLVVSQYGLVFSAPFVFCLGLIGILLVSGFGVGLVYAILRDKNVVQARQPTWGRTSIEWYDLAKVPDFALQTAIDIRERCPDASILVEECVIEDVVIDPFLVVHTGWASGIPMEYYVEVWDEPEFKK